MKNNEKMTLDDQVRAALNNFAEPYNAEHWQKMSERLDALDAGDASFDDTLRGRLTDISALPMADAWSKIAEKLDNWDAADVSFDKALRGRLADVAVVPSMADWSKMSAALDTFEDTDTEFDDVLRKKLENIAAKHPNHWAMMNERLDREFTLKGKIVRYKIIEAALMLFAFFTVLNVVDFTNKENFEAKVDSELFQNADKVSKPTTTEGADVNNKNDAAKTMPTQGQKGLLPTTNDAKSFDNSPNWRLRGGIQNEQKVNQNGQPQNVAPTQQPSLTPTSVPIVDNSVRNAENWDLSSSMHEGEQIESKVLKTNEATDVQAFSDALLTSKNTDAPSNAANVALVEVVAPISTLQANLLKNNDLDVPVNVIKPNLDKKGRWRLSTFGTAALDWVTTSYVASRVQSFQKQAVANVGINALVGYKRGKVELETGLMVNQKKYSIANVEIRSGSVVTRGAKIEKPQDLRLSILSIPLNVNVQLKDARRWNVYAHTGVAANAIVDAFDRRIVVTQSVVNGNAPPPPPTDVESATYSKGLINGGETRENVFFTGHIGLGIEYKKTMNMSLFLQPTANFMLTKQGVGSLNDRIRTYSIQGGAKWRL
jgi:hypothetical protein